MLAKTVCAILVLPARSEAQAYSQGHVLLVWQERIKRRVVSLTVSSAPVVRLTMAVLNSTGRRARSAQAGSLLQRAASLLVPIVRWASTVLDRL